MVDVFELSRILVEDVKARYSDDIAIVAYYGSYAHGTANAKSDLDFFFIPTRPNWWDASRQFILDGIGYDFWPVSWERAEGMAEFNEGKVSIIADCRVLYHRSEEDLARLGALKDNIALMATPEKKGVMLSKAMVRLKDSYMHLFNMSLPESQGDLAVARFEAGRVVASVLDALALANQTYFKRGLGQNYEQALSLKVKPSCLAEALTAICRASNPGEIRALCEGLVVDSRSCLLGEQRAVQTSASYTEVFNGCFEEVKSAFNKIVSACEREDWDTAFHASLCTQSEMSEFLARAEEGVEYTEFNTFAEHRRAGDGIELPDLAGTMRYGEYASLRESVLEFESVLRKHLEAKGVAIAEFATLEEFRAEVRGRIHA